MLSLTFKRSHAGGGGNTANFDFVQLLAGKPGGLSTWVLRLSNLAKSQGPLLWRRGESERTQGTGSGLPVAGTTQASPHHRVMVGKSQHFHKMRGHRSNGHWEHTLNIVQLQVQELCLSLCLLFKCLWARCSPSLASHVSYFFHHHTVLFGNL